jgi:hypothetical protein
MGNKNQKENIRNLIKDLNDRNKCKDSIKKLKELCWDDKKSKTNKKYAIQYRAIHDLVDLLDADFDSDIKNQALDLITYLTLI